MLTWFDLSTAVAKVKPAAGSLAAGLIASLCCGGSLVFASLGLGAFYSALRLSWYIPETLAAGTLSIVGINYFYYRRVAKRVDCPSGNNLRELRRSMVVSAALGLAVMAGNFVFLEWLNHAVVNPHRFLAHPEYEQALIPGVPSIRLIYALASFMGLALLWAMPFPHRVPERTGTASILRLALRVSVLTATVGLLIALVFGLLPRGGYDRPPNVQSSPGHMRQH